MSDGFFSTKPVRIGENRHSVPDANQLRVSGGVSGVPEGGSSRLSRELAALPHKLSTLLIREGRTAPLDYWFFSRKRDTSSLKSEAKRS